MNVVLGKRAGAFNGEAETLVYRVCFISILFNPANECTKIEFMYDYCRNQGFVVQNINLCEFWTGFNQKREFATWHYAGQNARNVELSASNTHISSKNEHQSCDFRDYLT